jgi:DNA adenine methylase
MQGAQLELFREGKIPQLLKWIGNKQRFTSEILRQFPANYRTYIEPFVGSGALLGALNPAEAMAGDALGPLIELWRLVQTDPKALIDFYSTTWSAYLEDAEVTYNRVKDSYNQSPNPYDLLFLSRSCYGGVVRFTREGRISTPIGPHRPIPPAALSKRMYAWHERIRGVEFIHADFEQTMNGASRDDLVYCDPPYSYTQRILYGAQTFQLERLWKAIDRCKSVGARVVLSLDGRKKSGTVKTSFDIPHGLFARSILIDCGRSMLRRFQMRGQSLETEVVEDRLLLTW